ncbi:MAG: hypothetical protein ABIB43_06180 [archaeon]
MKLKRFKNKDNAINSVRKYNVQYDNVIHKFPKGYIVGEHYHLNNATEWVIFDSGEADLICNNRVYNIKPVNQAIVAIISPKERHSLEAKTNIIYEVFRDKYSTTIWVD